MSRHKINYVVSYNEILSCHITNVATSLPDSERFIETAYTLCKSLCKSQATQQDEFNVC